MNKSALFGFGGNKKSEPSSSSEREYVNTAFKNWNHKTDNLRYFNEPKASDSRIKDYLKYRHSIISAAGPGGGYDVVHDRLNPKKAEEAYYRGFVKAAATAGYSKLQATAMFYKRADSAGMVPPLGAPNNMVPNFSQGQPGQQSGQPPQIPGAQPGQPPQGQPVPQGGPAGMMPTNSVAQLMQQKQINPVVQNARPVLPSFLR